MIYPLLPRTNAGGKKHLYRGARKMAMTMTMALAGQPPATQPDEFHEVSVPRPVCWPQGMHQFLFELRSASNTVTGWKQVTFESATSAYGGSRNEIIINITITIT